MRKRWLLYAGVIAAMLAMVAAPMVAAGGKDTRQSGGGLDTIGLTADNRLIVFGTNNPGGANNVGTITGLVGDTSILGIDYRPATGELIGLGNAGGIYSLNDATAAATKKSQLTGATLAGSSFGVDFNPTVDRLRIISDTGQNLRVDVTTGAATVDGTLNYTAGTAATGVTGAAYTNNDADANTATTLFDLDSTMDQTVIQAPANSGSLSATGKLGGDSTSTIGFDIYSEIRGGTTVAVHAFASAKLVGDDRTRFFSVNLLQGRASAMGAFAPRNQVTGIAIQLDQ